MHRFRLLKPRIFKRNMSAFINKTPSEYEYDLRKVLLVSKTTRWEYENLALGANVDEAKSREILMERGRGHLLKSHEEHKNFEKQVINQLDKLNVEVKIVDRYDRPEDLINWADTIISVGGDGTYLMAANKINDQSKPVIGLNSCPKSSIGYLCLPKIFSQNVSKTLCDIKKRKFTWMYRTRIKVRLYGENITRSWVSVHEEGQRLRSLWDCDAPIENTSAEYFDVPQLSLNEVFISENIPAVVSHLDVAVDDGEFTTTKNSGICVCTGSGSSSWNFSMNRISREAVEKLFTIGGYETDNVNNIVKAYNSSLRYAPDDKRMNYTIRDMIPSVFGSNTSNLSYKGFANKIVIKSQCRDGGLVIDGGCSYQFNSGATAILTTDPSTMLKTIAFNE